MGNFEVKEDFYVNGEKIKIISGAIHYFRVVPEYWRDRLEKLKALGCNTVETYIPWNLHENKKGEFDFSKEKDFVKFIKIAQELELFVILRPSPYICAEYEFGGLPAWLLKDNNMRIRSNHEGYLMAVDSYYKELFKLIVPLQITKGGSVIMIQVENEYGSFGNNKKYLNNLKEIMIKYGAEVQLFTSDGGCRAMLESGAITEDGILPTVNCGGHINEQIDALAEFMDENNIKGPLMCMEFWIGWFDSWGEEHKVRDLESAAKDLDEILKRGHVNIYMLHGGTTFGFMNGGNYSKKFMPQTSSYDYDALLTEWGDITPKYIAFKEVISKYVDIPKVEFSTKIKKKNYGEIKLSNKVSLFSTLNTLATPIRNEETLSMEMLDQNYGYVLYRSNVGKKRVINRLSLLGMDDRAQIFINHKLVNTQYKPSFIGQEISIELTKEEDNVIDVLVENICRVNYGATLLDRTQSKGIKGGVFMDSHIHSGWNHYCLDLENIDKVDFSLEYEENTPAFYEYVFNIDEACDTFLNLEGFGKGCAFINNFNLGRFWDIGPTGYLYIPGPLLNKGENKIVIFETEGRYEDVIRLSDEPYYIK